MTANLKRAIRILRAYGNKVETRKGRIVAINDERVSKGGINSRTLEKKAFSMSQRDVGTFDIYTKKGTRLSINPASITKRVYTVDGEKHVDLLYNRKAGEITKTEKEHRQIPREYKRLHEARAKYNEIVSRMQGPQMSDRILAQKMARGESSDNIIRDMRRNLLHSFDVASNVNVQTFNNYIAANEKYYPKTAAWIKAHPDYDMTDTHLAEAQYVKYDDTMSLEERDSKMVQLLEEGSKAASDRMKDLGNFYAGVED